MPSQRKTGLEHARDVFKGARLPIPPIPARFERAIREIHPWCFSTRKIDGMGMYFFDEHLKEPFRRSTRPYVAFSHAGHGVNSYAVTYHLLFGKLALFVQHPFGGIYSDARRDRSGIRALFRRCAALAAAVDRARAQGHLRKAGRLVVVESVMRWSYAWGWLDPKSATEENAENWINQHRLPTDEEQRRSAADLPTALALRWVRSLERRPTPSRIALAGREGQRLTPRDVPSQGAEWSTINRFARSIDGYERCGSFEACARIGNGVRDRFRRTAELPADLFELRIALFFEQRRFHHFGEEPKGGDMEYIRRLVAAIRREVREASKHGNSIRRRTRT